MSDRRIDITGLQVLASVLATVTGAVAASYLGVAGTIIGAAVMSIASTAGSAVYKHYLGRTAGRLKELKEAAPMAAHRAAERMTGAGTHVVPQYHNRAQAGGDELPTVVLPVTHVSVNGHAPGSAADTSSGEGPNRETAARSAGVDDHAVGGYWLADGTSRRRRSLLLPGWLRERPSWLLSGVAAIGLFAGVVGGITVFELAAGKPLDAVVWHRSGSGTTVGGVVGSKPSHSTAPLARTAKRPGKTSSSATPGSSATNSPTPSPTPSSGSPSPTSSSGSPTPTPSSSSPTATPTVSSSSAHPRSS